MKFIVKRDKRNAGHGALYGTLPRCEASACVSMPTTSVSILESDGAHAPNCTNDCQYCHATRRKLKLETVYHLQREISRMRAKSACVIKSAWQKTPLIAKKHRLLNRDRLIEEYGDWHIWTINVTLTVYNPCHARARILLQKRWISISLPQ
jgi:hypothetical protein